MISHVLIDSFAVLIISVIYFSSGSTLKRITRDVGNDTKCEELDKPSWSINSLRDVTLDAWPWHCLNLRYNSSFDDLISNYSSDIFDAASTGSVGFVQYYVEKVHVGLNLSKDGQTPLHLAVKNGSLNVVKYIATKITPSDLNAPDYENKTPLLCAALYGRLDIAKYLLSEANVDSSYEENEKNGVLKMAAKGGNLTIVKYLIHDRGYTVRSNDEQLLLSAASGGNVHLIKYLIYKKSLTKIGTSSRGDTALHMAALLGRLEAVQFFISTLRYKVDARNWEEATPAHLATEGGSLIVLRYLIEKRGADLNARNGYGDSLMHVAAHCGHLAIVKYLVDVLSMSIELKDYTLRTPLHRAVRQNHLDVVRYLACEKYADLNSKDKDGRNLLHQAVLSGNVDMVKYLVNDMNMGVRINEVDPLLHRTATLEAAYWGRLTILKFLVDHKNTKTWIVDSDGKNLLQIAAREGHLEIVKYLVEEKSFDVNARNPGGLSAYDFATMFEGDKKELLKYLDKRMNPDNETDDSQ